MLEALKNSRHTLFGFNHEKKNAKATLDNAVEEELSVLEADLEDSITNPLPIN